MTESSHYTHTIVPYNLVESKKGQVGALGSANSGPVLRN